MAGNVCGMFSLSIIIDGKGMESLILMKSSFLSRMMIWFFFLILNSLLYQLFQNKIRLDQQTVILTSSYVRYLKDP